LAHQAHRIEHRDPSPLGPDQVEVPQGRERLRDRLARGAGPAGELLLGDRQRDRDRIPVGLAVALGEFEQPRRDPPQGLCGGELDPAPRC